MSCGQDIGSNSWVRLMNRFVIIINININLGRNGILGIFLEMSSVNVLGELFLWLPKGRKDTGSEITATYMEKGKTNV